jgi:hypothetical protein
MVKIYRGWIHGEKRDEEVLLDMGIKVGKWDEGLKAWEPCDVTGEQLEKLDRLWGRFIWGLEVVEVEK